MIKRIPLKVEYVDGTIERALCTGADSITFERTYDLGMDQVGKRLEYVWFLAWAALTRTEIWRWGSRSNSQLAKSNCSMAMRTTSLAVFRA
jgi:hypothetical protein